MSSRTDIAVLVALRHFKMGQLCSWVNNVDTSTKAFERCLRAIDYIKKRENAANLEEIEGIARIMLGRVDNTEAIVLPDINSSRERHLLTCSLIVTSDNSAEIRAILHMSPEVLRDVAPNCYPYLQEGAESGTCLQYRLNATNRARSW
jgi:hypothetical protein